MLSNVIKDWRLQQIGGSFKDYIQTEEDKGSPTIKVRQDGRQGGRATPAKSITQTVLSSINSVDFSHVLAAKQEMLSWKNFM